MNLHSFRNVTQAEIIDFTRDASLVTFGFKQKRFNSLLNTITSDTALTFNTHPYTN